jgi:hypothetical protein
MFDDVCRENPAGAASKRLHQGDIGQSLQVMALSMRGIPLRVHAPE